MRTENRFDPVFDCQQVFKALMNALARYLRVKRVGGGDDAPFRAVALTLLDNWRSFLCRGRPRPGRREPAGADLWRARPSGRGRLPVLPPYGGTGPCDGKRQNPAPFRSPTKARRFSCWRDSLTGGEAFFPHRPGIEGTVTVTLPAPAGPGWRRGRPRPSSLPCGVDLYFLTPQGPGHGGSPGR